MLNKRIYIFFTIVFVLALTGLFHVPQMPVAYATQNTARLLDDNSDQTGISSNPLYVQGTVTVSSITSTITATITVATDLEGKGDITVGTSEVEISITGKSRELRIRADVDNTGIIFIGKTGVLNDKTNDYVRLHAGDELIMSYDDATNALFAISDTATQTVNVGALL
jgi:hypothetical protein